MWSSIIVLAIAAALTAGAAYWVLRAYRRAGGGTATARPALAACAVVALLGLGVYLVIGRPELPDAPYAARLDALRERDLSTYTFDEALAVLHEGAKANPDDPQPHVYSGQLLLRQGRAQEAAQAFDAALRRDPTSAEALFGLGQSIVGIEGRVTPEALAAFQQAGAHGDDPRPWAYQAMAAMEAGQEAEASRLWGEALQRMGPDHPMRPVAEQFASGEAGR